MRRERFGSSGVAAAADGSSGAGPAVGDQSGINQRVARAFVRVRRPGALTFAAITYQRGRSGRGLPPARTRTRSYHGTSRGDTGTPTATRGRQPSPERST